MKALAAPVAFLTRKALEGPEPCIAAHHTPAYNYDRWISSIGSGLIEVASIIANNPLAEGEIRKAFIDEMIERMEALRSAKS